MIDRARAHARRRDPARRAPGRSTRTGAFTPAVMPRALALSPDGATLYVTGERAGALFAIDLATRAGALGRGRQRAGRRRGRRPTARAVFVACSQDDDGRRASTPRASTVTARVAGRAASRGRSRWSPATARCSSRTSSVAGVTAIDPATLGDRARPGRSPTSRRARRSRGSPHGQAARALRRRGAAGHRTSCGSRTSCSAPTRRSPSSTSSRPCSRRSSILRDDGAYRAHAVDRRARHPGHRRRVRRHRLGTARARVHRATARSRSSSTPTARTCSSSTRAPASRPRSCARCPVTCRRASCSRPTTASRTSTSATPATSRSCALDRTRPASRSPSTARRSRGSPPIRCRPTLRLGQHLFYSANSDEFPITQNHWVACASCHIEGRSDAVTWRFEQGPRDTPIERRRHARHRLSVPHRRSQPRAGLLAHDQRRAGRHVRSGRAGARCSTRSPPTSTSASRCRSRRPPIRRSSPRGTRDLRAPRRRLRRLPRRPAVHRLGRRQSDARSRAARSRCTTSARASTTRRSPTSRTPTSTATRAPRACSTRRRCAASRRRRRTSTTAAPPTLRDVLELTRGTMGDIDALSADDLAALVEYLRSL